MWSHQIVEQTTTLKNPFPVNKPYMLLSVETSWVLIWHTSHPSHNLALSPNTADAYRADTLPTAGIIKAFPSQTVKTFPACNFAARLMSNQLLPQEAKEEQSNSICWWQHQGRMSLPCTWSRDARAALAEPALSKPIPQQKALCFEAASSGPPYYEMDTSIHPRCTCTALILQKNPQKSFLHLILYGTVPPSALVLWHPPSEERCVSFYITTRAVGVTWFLLVSKAGQFSFEALLKAVEGKETRRQDVNKIK